MITLSTALLVAIFISLIKPLIDVLIAPTNQAHDSVIRVLAVLSAIVGTVVYTYSTGGIATGVILWQTLGTGLQAGLAAIFSYHAVSGDFFSTTPTIVTSTPITPFAPVVASTPAPFVSTQPKIYTPEFSPVTAPTPVYVPPVVAPEPVITYPTPPPTHPETRTMN